MESMVYLLRDLRSQAEMAAGSKCPEPEFRFIGRRLVTAWVGSEPNTQDEA